MKRIIIELVEDERLGGYTIFSNDKELKEIVAQGNDVIDALHNFANVIEDVKKWNN